MLRTVKWWVLYCPETKTLMRQPFRTKKEAVGVKLGSRTYENAVVFQVKGNYVRPTVRR